MHNNDWRRRNYFIKKGFQLRFVGRFLIVAVAGFAAAGYLVYRSVESSAEEVFYSNHFRIANTSDLVVPALLKVNLVVVLLVLAAVSIAVLVVSHRLAGPIFRLGKAAEKIGTGDLTGSFELRAKDEIKSLSDSFKEMNGSLRDQFADMKREASAIESYSKKMLEGDCVTREESDDFYRLTCVFGKRLEKFIVR
jgi:methyl-accepting chemotaxis protein